MNEFGGNWTANKIEILVEYANAYLTIMHKYADRFGWKLLYFDGFAGSGEISRISDDVIEDTQTIIGAAVRILQIEYPRPFNMYYFVEKKPENYRQLVESTRDKFPHKEIHVVEEDCNQKIQAMSVFLNSKKKYKTLAYIDPCGMQLDWKSLQTLERLSVDVWILIPTGMGVNRLLKRNGQIDDTWLAKLETFLGMPKEEILSYFYKQKVEYTLFGEEVVTTKEDRAVERSAELYKERLGSLFKYVSEPYVLKNRANSIMFHFLMASNNLTAANIANDIVRKYNSH